jgi:pimeloyl-ACP methyl ester carboxylesterase
MIVDLVQLMTRDGVRLDGSFQAPSDKTAPHLPVDSCLFIHGTGGSFYSASLFDPFSERFLQLGCAVLRVNTRGHDLMSTAATTQGGRRLGAAYEIVDDCRHDIAAWVDWIVRRGYSRIGLVGHSLGAVKAIYTLAIEPPQAIACLVALSPPRLSHSHFSSSDQADEFLETYRAAEAHVQEGRSGALMEVRVPLPFVVTAGGYVEKYGPTEQYNIIKHVAKLKTPTLFTFGSAELESNMAFRGLPELLAPVAAAHEHMQVEIVPGADHFYSGQRPDLIARTEKWLRAI